MIRGLVSFVAGVIFAVGLVIGGMTQPSKVAGFLDFTGAWDASLVFVMGGAVMVHFVLFRLILRRGSPVFGAKFHLPTRRDLDGRLIAGAAIFGLGWGLGGFCPGPGIVSVASITSGASAAIFVVAMLAGMWLHDARERMRAPAAQESGPRPAEAPTPSS